MGVGLSPKELREESFPKRLDKINLKNYIIQYNLISKNKLIILNFIEEVKNGKQI